MRQLSCLLAIIMMCFAAPVFAQSQNDATVTVKRSDLPSDLLAKLDQANKVQQITENLQTAEKWAGMGKEIGVAVNDGLKAVTEQTAEFSQTDVGRLTMALVAWKVLAKDAMGLLQMSLGMIVGIPMLIFANWFMIYYYRRTFVGRAIKQTSEGWLWWKKTTYNYLPPAIMDWSMHPSDESFLKGLAIVLFWVVIFIANGILLAVTGV